jgi:hypothetical protein
VATGRAARAAKKKVVAENMGPLLLALLDVGVGVVGALSASVRRTLIRYGWIQQGSEHGNLRALVLSRPSSGGTNEVDARCRRLCKRTDDGIAVNPMPVVGAMLADVDGVVVASRMSWAPSRGLTLWLRGLRGV